MPLTLYQAFVPSALQMLGTARHLVTRAADWCAEHDCAEQVLIGHRIHPEMFPFAYQVKSVAVHTAGALRAVPQGAFSPDVSEPPASFAALHEAVDAASAQLEAADEAAMEMWIGQPMQFRFRDYAMDFRAEDFLLSFSQPNFYFHAATAYDILRQKGVDVGKRDFMGRVRIAS